MTPVLIRKGLRGALFHVLRVCWEKQEIMLPKLVLSKSLLKLYFDILQALQIFRTIGTS